MTSWRWIYFTEKEMACPCCGETRMDPDFMDRLQEFRFALDTPMGVNSAYRCPAYEKSPKIKGSGVNHPSGRGLDFRCNLSAMKIVEMAINHGFSIGVKAHGPRAKRYFHIDTAHDVPTLWTYS